MPDLLDDGSCFGDSGFGSSGDEPHVVVNLGGEGLATYLLFCCYRVVGAGDPAGSTAAAQVGEKQGRFSFNPENRVFSADLRA